MEEKEAIQKKSHTSFGNLILADEKTSPQFSKNMKIEKLKIIYYFQIILNF